VIYYYSEKETQDWMAVLQQNWQAVGVKANPRYVDSATVGDAMAKDTFQTAYVGGASDIDPDDTLAYLSLPAPACSDGAQNNTRYCNQQLYDLFKKEQAIADVTARKQVIDQWQELIMEELPTAPLWEPYRYSFLKKNIYGFTFGPLGGNTNGYYAWE